MCEISRASRRTTLKFVLDAHWARISEVHFRTKNITWVIIPKFTDTEMWSRPITFCILKSIYQFDVSNISATFEKGWYQMTFLLINSIPFELHLKIDSIENFKTTNELIKLQTTQYGWSLLISLSIKFHFYLHSNMFVLIPDDFFFYYQTGQSFPKQNVWIWYMMCNNRITSARINEKILNW